MSDSDSREMATLTLTCLDAEECTVAFEPWGSEYLLKRHDALYVRFLRSDMDHIEISYMPDRLIVGLWTDAEISVSNRAGERIVI